METDVPKIQVRSYAFLFGALNQPFADKGGSSRNSWPSRALKQESDTWPGLPTTQPSAPAIRPN